jgi:hypothetical protein
MVVADCGDDDQCNRQRGQPRVPWSHGLPLMFSTRLQTRL